LLACRRLGLDEEHTLTPVLREAAGAAERVSELGREPGGADQDAKGAEGDWTRSFPHFGPLSVTRLRSLSSQATGGNSLGTEAR
jgi:hypothetical protein